MSVTDEQLDDIVFAIEEELFQIVRYCNIDYESANSVTPEIRKFWISKHKEYNEKEKEDQERNNR